MQLILKVQSPSMPIVPSRAAGAVGRCGGPSPCARGPGTCWSPASSHSGTATAPRWRPAPWQPWTPGSYASFPPATPRPCAPPCQDRGPWPRHCHHFHSTVNHFQEHLVFFTCVEADHETVSAHQKSIFLENRHYCWYLLLSPSSVSGSVDQERGLWAAAITPRWSLDF